MAHWDVSSELRGEHGKWSKSGIAHRLAKEAETEGAKKEAGKIEAGHRVAYKGGNSVGTVHHLDEKGVPHVVWDRGRGKPVRTPAHHLSHVGEQHKSAPKPGAPERGARETPSQERHLDETLRKLSGRQEEPSLAGRPAASKRREALKAGTEKPFMRGERVKHSSGKIGVVTGNEKDDPYGHGRRVVPVRYDEGQGRTRNTTVYAETLQRHEGKPLPDKVQGNLKEIGQRAAAANKGRGGTLSGDTGFTPGKGVGGRYRGAKPESYYRGLNEAELQNLVRSRGSQAAQDELDRRAKQKEEFGNRPHTPDELRKMVADMEAKQRAKTEAENKARFPGGSTTIRSGPMGGTESAAATRGLRGGGMQKTRSFEEVNKEYNTANAALHRLLESRHVGPGAIPARQRELSRLEGELRGMGARRTFGANWEMPPKPGTPEHAKEKLRNELMSINEQLHDQHHEAGAPLYTDVELISARFSDVNQQLKSGQKTIVVKVPSGSEIQMSRETAQYLVDQATKPRTSQPVTTQERRARQQARLSEAAARRGITSRRKMALCPHQSITSIPLPAQARTSTMQEPAIRSARSACSWPARARRPSRSWKQAPITRRTQRREPLPARAG